jgi:hypothetical protein
MQIPCITFVQTAQTSPVYNSCWHASQCLDCVAINKFYHLPALSVSLCNSLAASRANCICSYTAWETCALDNSLGYMSSTNWLHSHFSVCLSSLHKTLLWSKVLPIFL